MYSFLQKKKTFSTLLQCNLQFNSSINSTYHKVGYFFAWTGHMNYLLLFPALLGVINEAIYVVNGYTWCEGGISNANSVTQACMALATALWVIYYKNSWLAQQKLLARKWGTTGCEESEKDRPQFRGSEYYRDPVTLREVRHFKKDKKRKRSAFVQIHAPHLSFTI